MPVEEADRAMFVFVVCLLCFMLAVLLYLKLSGWQPTNAERVTRCSYVAEVYTCVESYEDVVKE